jgi:hypothetical protein
VATLWDVGKHLFDAIVGGYARLFRGLISSNKCVPIDLLARTDLCNTKHRFTAYYF